MNESTKDNISGYLENQMLIAMPGMLDPNFVRSVTLLCQHTDEGAIGITINRVSGFTLGEVMDQLDIRGGSEELRARRVLEGGPVNRDRGFVLHSPMEGFESSLPISPEITVTTSRDVLQALAEGTGPDRWVVALGYAGWGDGQLEEEMRQNAWLSVPADSAIVFELPVDERWAKAVARLGVDISNLHGVGGHA